MTRGPYYDRTMYIVNYWDTMPVLTFSICFARQTNQLRPPCELVNTAESASFILGLLSSHLRQLGNKKEEKKEEKKEKIKKK